MPQFKYTARNENGKKIVDKIESPNVSAVKSYLTKKKLFPIKIEIYEESVFAQKIMEMFVKVSTKDLTVFTRQLANLIEAGLTLLSSLDALIEQTINPELKKIIANIKKEVENGKTFSESLKKYPNIFSDLYVNSIRAGEATGTLAEICSKLAKLLENEMKLNTKFKSAIRYPAIVLLVIFCVFIGLTTFVLPNYVKLYSKFGTDLPLPTKLLLGVRKIIVFYWIHSIVLLFSGIFAFRQYIKTPNGKLWFHKMILRTPVLGSVFTKIYIARFANSFSAMIKSGVPMILSLNIVAEAVGNQVIALEILQVKETVKKGQGIAKTFLESKTIPILVGKMIAIGEKTGTMEKMLDKVAEYYIVETDYALDTLFDMLEPFLIVVLGVVILLFALGIFMPSWYLIEVFMKS